MVDIEKKLIYNENVEKNIDNKKIGRILYIVAYAIKEGYMDQVVNFDMKKKNKIKKIIAVMSGKGGVGKSTVTGLVASTLRNAGHTVGVLDADITGPSIPKLFGVNKQKVFQTEEGLSTAESVTGIKVMSLNLLLENENDPVIWRGPILGSTVQQFHDDVVWGELDYLVIDLPPGTSDVTLTVMQQIKVDGIVVVSTPQDLVQLIVDKSIIMANRLETPIVGLVENMSYFMCDNCSEKHYLFGESKIKNVLEHHNIPLLAEIPIDKDLVTLADEGRIELYTKTNHQFANNFSENLLSEISKLS